MTVGRVRVEVVRVPGWERFEWLRAGFSTRPGGVSEAYGGADLNLGFTKDDDPEAVRENRRRVVEVVGGGEWPLATLRQVHGTEVKVVGADWPVGVEADGLVTSAAGVMLGIQVADCVPVLVADVRRRVAGAFHAGWRGTVAGIVGRGVETMQDEFGCSTEDLVAAVGPSIGACCYAVGDEVRTAFADESLFDVRAGELYLNLWEANRRQLVAAGVGDVAVIGECTGCALMGGRRKYFSHRVEKGFTGRAMGLIGVAVLPDGPATRGAVTP